MDKNVFSDKMEWSKMSLVCAVGSLLDVCLHHFICCYFFRGAVLLSLCLLLLYVVIQLLMWHIVITLSWMIRRGTCLTCRWFGFFGCLLVCNMLLWKCAVCRTPVIAVTLIGSNLRWPDFFSIRKENYRKQLAAMTENRHQQLAAGGFIS